jgi:hypothetical protein
MTEEAKAALEILERTMGVEQEGRQFHPKATQITQDKKGLPHHLTTNGNAMT